MNGHSILFGSISIKRSGRPDDGVPWWTVSVEEVRYKEHNEQPESESQRIAAKGDVSMVVVEETLRLVWRKAAKMTQLHPQSQSHWIGEANCTLILPLEKMKSETAVLEEHASRTLIVSLWEHNRLDPKDLLARRLATLPRASTRRATLNPVARISLHGTSSTGAASNATKSAGALQTTSAIEGSTLLPGHRNRSRSWSAFCMGDHWAPSRNDVQHSDTSTSMPRILLFLWITTVTAIAGISIHFGFGPAKHRFFQSLERKSQEEAAKSGQETSTSTSSSLASSDENPSDFECANGKSGFETSTYGDPSQGQDKSTESSEESAKLMPESDFARKEPFEQPVLLMAVGEDVQHNSQQASEQVPSRGANGLCGQGGIGRNRALFLLQNSIQEPEGKLTGIWSHGGHSRRALVPVSTSFKVKAPSPPRTTQIPACGRDGEFAPKCIQEVQSPRCSPSYRSDGKENINVTTHDPGQTIAGPTHSDVKECSGDSSNVPAGRKIGSIEHAADDAKPIIQTGSYPKSEDVSAAPQAPAAMHTRGPSGNQPTFVVAEHPRITFANQEAHDQPSPPHDAVKEKFPQQQELSGASDPSTSEDKRKNASSDGDATSNSCIESGCTNISAASQHTHISSPDLTPVIATKGNNGRSNHHANSAHVDTLCRGDMLDIDSNTEHTGFSHNTSKQNRGSIAEKHGDDNAPPLVEVIDDMVAGIGEVDSPSNCSRFRSSGEILTQLSENTNEASQNDFARAKERTIKSGITEQVKPANQATTSCRSPAMDSSDEDRADTVMGGQSPLNKSDNLPLQQNVLETVGQRSPNNRNSVRCTVVRGGAELKNSSLALGPFTNADSCSDTTWVSCAHGEQTMQFPPALKNPDDPIKSRSDQEAKYHSSGRIGQRSGTKGPPSGTESYVSTLPPDSDCDSERTNYVPSPCSTETEERVLDKDEDNHACPSRQEAKVHKPTQNNGPSQEKRRKHSADAHCNKVHNSRRLRGRRIAKRKFPPDSVFDFPASKMETTVRSPENSKDSKKSKAPFGNDASPKKRIAEHIDKDCGSVKFLRAFPPSPSKKARPFQNSNIVPDWVPSIKLQSLSQKFLDDEGWEGVTPSASTKATNSRMVPRTIHLQTPEQRAVN